jgi:serine/threonine protein kinase
MSDVYSLGVLLFEVYSRSEPYEGENPDEVLKALADKDVHKCPTIPTSTPPLISSLMVDCFNADPNLRPSVQELDIRLKRLEAESVTPTGVEYMSHGRKTSGDMLLDDMFPKHVADALRAGKKVRTLREKPSDFFYL